VEPNPAIFPSALKKNRKVRVKRSKKESEKGKNKVNK